MDASRVEEIKQYAAYAPRKPAKVIQELLDDRAWAQGQYIALQADRDRLAAQVAAMQERLRGMIEHLAAEEKHYQRKSGDYAFVDDQHGKWINAGRADGYRDAENLVRAALAATEETANGQ